MEAGRGLAAHLALLVHLQQKITAFFDFAPRDTKGFRDTGVYLRSTAWHRLPPRGLAILFPGDRGASVPVGDETEGEENRCHPRPVAQPRIFLASDEITMRALSRAHNRSSTIAEREEGSLRNPPVLRGTRESLDRGKAVRVTFNERKTLGALASSLLRLSLSVPPFLGAIPFAFFGCPSTKRIAGPRQSRFHTSPPLFLTLCRFCHRSPAICITLRAARVPRFKRPPPLPSHVPNDFSLASTEPRPDTVFTTASAH